MRLLGTQTKAVCRLVLFVGELRGQLAASTKCQKKRLSQNPKKQHAKSFAVSPTPFSEPELVGFHLGERRLPKVAWGWLCTRQIYRFVAASGPWKNSRRRKGYKNAENLGSESVRNRFGIGSESVLNRNRFGIGSESVRNRFGRPRREN